MGLWKAAVPGSPKPMELQGCEATAATAEVFRFGTQWKFFCREQDVARHYQVSLKGNIHGSGDSGIWDAIDRLSVSPQIMKWAIYVGI